MATKLADTKSDNQTLAINTHPVTETNQVALLVKDILESLYYIQCKSRELATKNDWYMAVAYTVRSRLMKNWIDTLHDMADKKIKLVGYLSAEFLVGPHLGNAMINLGIYDDVQKATQHLGLDLRQLMDIEEEPGLING
jgi:starch phosphorylase